MTPDAVFSFCNGLATVGWIILIVVPFWHSSDKFIIGIIITLLAIIYAWLLFSEFRFTDIKKFGSVRGVMELFDNPKLVVAGWVHYLAFDLMIGIFVKKNSLKYGISHWLIIPCLLVCFMIAPVGLLLYLLLRWIVTKDYFNENF